MATTATSASEKQTHDVYTQNCMTVICDRDLNIAEIINPQYCVLLQSFEDALVGLNVADLERLVSDPNKASAAVFVANVRRAMLENKNVYFEYEAVLGDGAPAYSVCFAEPGSDGRLYVNVVRIEGENLLDVRKKFANYIVHSTIDSLSIGVYLRHIDENGNKRYVLFNDVMKQLFECDDVPASKYWNQQKDDFGDEKTLQAEEALSAEEMLQDDKGDMYRCMVFSKKKVKSCSGGYYIITTVIDITERRRNEILQDRQFALLDSIYRNLPVGIVLYDKAGGLISLNRMGMDMLGVSDITAFTKFNVFNDPNMPDNVRKCLLEGQNVDYDAVYDFDRITSDNFFATSCRGQKLFSVKAVTIHGKRDGAVDGYLQIFDDVTEKRRVTDELEQKHRLIETFYDTVPVGIEIYDKDGRLAELNPAGMRMLGVADKKAVLGLCLFDNPGLSEEMKSRLRRGEDVHYEGSYDFDQVKSDIYGLNLSGVHYFDVRVSALHNEHNEQTGYMAAMQDRTEERRREYELEETQRNLELALNAGRVSTWKFDIQGRFFTTILGDALAHGGISLDDFLKRAHPDDVAILQTIFREMAAGEKRTASFVLRYYDDAYGDYRCYDSQMEARTDEKGKVTFVVGTQRDITEKCLKQLEMESVRKSLDMALDATNVLAWDYNVLTKKHRILYGERMQKVHSGIAKGMCNFHPDDLPKYKALVHEILSGEKELGNLDVREKDDDGKYYYFEHTISSVKNSSGKVVGLIGSILDVSERRKQRIELEKTQRDLSVAIEAGDMSTWVYDVKTRILKRVGGVAVIEDNLSFDRFSAMLPAESLAQFRSIYQEMVDGTKEKGQVVFQFQHPQTGKMLYCQAFFRGVVKNGVVRYVIGTSKDVTESYTRQMQLEKSERKTSLINRACGIVQWDYTPAKHVVNTYSSAAIQPGVDMDIQTYLSYIHPDDVAKVQDLVHRIDTLGEVHISNFEIRSMIPGSDTYKRVVLDAVPFKDKQGRILKYTGIRRDISEWVKLNEQLTANNEHIRKANAELVEAQSHLELSNQLLNGIIDRVPGALYVKDVADDFRYMRVNQLSCDMIFRREDEVVGKTDFELFDSKIAEQKLYYDKRLLDGEQVVSYEDEVEHNGQKFYFQNNKSLIRTADGRTMILGISLDITKLHNANAELVAAREKAELSDKLKSAFLANMSHEIRTPLNAIVGFSSLLIETDDPQEKAEFGQLIATNSDQLLHLINDILDLSKIEAGMIEFKRERIDLSVCFNELAASLRLRVTNPNVKFIVENPYEHCFMTCDRNRITQVLTNFTTNAIKYTPSGSIRVGYQCVDGGIRLYVEDTGIGISEAKKPRVFHRFEKLDEFAQGTGLGLSISKAIVEVGGGKIGFESEEGKGSTFWAWKPCADIEIMPKSVAEGVQTKNV